VDARVTTVRDELEAAVAELREAGSETARLDAELLLGHVLGVDRTAVLAHPEAPLGDGQRGAFRTAVARRARGEPVAYIRGLKEFYGLAFTVDPRALIPRPETETLVELALGQVTGRLTSGTRPAEAGPFEILDVGTGCGAIAIALAVRLRRRGYANAVHFSATDIAPDALQLAVENAVGHGVADLVDFTRSDLLEPPPPRPVDLLLANLPYIPSAEIAGLPVAASFEPRLALDGGPDGLGLVRRILPRLPEVLTPDGAALLEIGSSQADAVETAVAEALPGWSVTIEPDLAGQPRVAAIGRP
jgi:release factor glutamine methyltransferase